MIEVESIATLTSVFFNRSSFFYRECAARACMQQDPLVEHQAAQPVIDSYQHSLKVFNSCRVTIGRSFCGQSACVPLCAKLSRIRNFPFTVNCNQFVFIAVKHMITIERHNHVLPSFRVSSCAGKPEQPPPTKTHYERYKHC